MAEIKRYVVALNIAAGIVYAAVVECPDTPVFDDPLERIELAVGLNETARLADFSARFKQEIRRIEPVAVGVVFPRRYSNWKYAEAFKRVSIEAAIMLATFELSTPARPITYTQIKQERMARAVEIPLPRLPELARNRWGSGISRYANDRVIAFAAATALGMEQ